ACLRKAVNTVLSAVEDVDIGGQGSSASDRANPAVPPLGTSLTARAWTPSQYARLTVDSLRADPEAPFPTAQAPNRSLRPDLGNAPSQPPGIALAHRSPRGTSRTAASPSIRAPDPARFLVMSLPAHRGPNLEAPCRLR